MLLFVMIDGLRHDYITCSDSPYLYALASEGLSGSVVPSFGFEPDAAYLAGLQPDEADGGVMYWRDPAHSPFRFARFLPVALDRLPEHLARYVRKAIRLLAQLTAREERTRRWASPAWIPLPLLPRFSFATTRRIDECGFLPAATVFDRLRATGCTWYFHGMPDYRVAAAVARDRFLAEFTGCESYAFVHISDLDSVGHRFGPRSAERKATLQVVDRILLEIVGHARAKSPELDLLILGDHGMVEVESTLDVRPAVQQLKDRGLAYDYFIDATLFRCWSQDASVLAAVRREFDGLPGVMEIGRPEAVRYGLCYRHNRFWDACWQAEAGFLFSPNFHNHHDRLLGMHGYLPGCRDNQSAFALSTPRLPERLRGQRLEAVDMRRFFATQLALLGLPQTSPPIESLI